MCGYFCKDLVTGYCLYIVKKSSSFSTIVRFKNDYSHLVAIGLMSGEICVYRVAQVALLGNVNSNWIPRAYAG